MGFVKLSEVNVNCDCSDHFPGLVMAFAPTGEHAWICPACKSITVVLVHEVHVIPMTEWSPMPLDMQKFGTVTKNHWGPESDSMPIDDEKKADE